MVLRLPNSWSNWNLEVLAEREGRARPHIKGVGSQSKLPTINCTGVYSMEVLVEREGGSGEEATYKRGWESEGIADN